MHRNGGIFAPSMSSLGSAAASMWSVVDTHEPAIAEWFLAGKWGGMRGLRKGRGWGARYGTRCPEEEGVRGGSPKN